MRRKVLGFVGVAILGLVLGAGIKLLTTFFPLVSSQSNEASIPQTQTGSTATTEGTTQEQSVNQETGSGSSTASNTGSSIIPEAKTDEGEMVVEGTVDNVSTKYRTIRFTQEMDDSSKKVSPRISILKDAIIEINGEQSTLEQVTVGDYVTMILNSSEKARSIQIKR